MKSIISAAALGLAMTGAAAAAPVFSDNFDYGNTTVLNAPSSLFTPNWTTTPAVDYLAMADPLGGFGTFCRGNVGCVDLDGTSDSSGLFATVASFAAGTYKLDYTLYGSSRGTTEDVTIMLGSYVLAITGIGSSDDASSSVVFSTTGGNLSFQNAGGDNVGAILAGVTLAAVPLPAGGLLLLSSLGGIAALRRRRKAS